MKNKKLCVRHSLYWLMLVFCPIFLGACVTSGGGAFQSLQRSLEVEATFQAGTIVPDHTYFIQGTNSEPEAIIALSNSFQLQSRLWEKVEWTQKELDTVVFWMQNAELGFCSTDGGYLVAQDGERLGLWYSKRDLTVIKGPTAGVVEIYPFKFMSRSPCQRQYIRDQL